MSSLGIERSRPAVGTPLIAGIVILVSIVTIAGILTWAPASNTGLSDSLSSPAASASSDAFRAGFRPLLLRAIETADELVALGESRERNLFHIRGGQDAMNAALAAADVWLVAHPPAAADEPAIATYRDGAAAIRKAMEEAQAGFLRFDFDRVARAMEMMRQGAASLDRAIALFG